MSEQQQNYKFDFFKNTNETQDSNMALSISRRLIFASAIIIGIIGSHNIHVYENNNVVNEIIQNEDITTQRSISDLELILNNPKMDKNKHFYIDSDIVNQKKSSILKENLTFADLNKLLQLTHTNIFMKNEENGWKLDLANLAIVKISKSNKSELNKLNEEYNKLYVLDPIKLESIEDYTYIKKINLLDTYGEIWWRAESIINNDKLSDEELMTNYNKELQKFKTNQQSKLDKMFQ